MTQTKKPTQPMAELYSRLAEYGFNPKYVKEMVLPEWWDDKIAQNPAGYAEGVSLVVRHLGLDIHSLEDHTQDLCYKHIGPSRFKKSQNVSKAELPLAECIALRAAHLACTATPAPAETLAASAAQIRSLLLQRNPASLDFSTLLNYCWECGIPVLHVSEFPASGKKMDGLAVRVSGRPAIVLAKNSKFSAWLLFLLAHELGHIICGHLRDEEPRVDEAGQTTEDKEEKEANAFAVELLTGDAHSEYDSATNLTTDRLLSAARAFGKANQIDPGVVVLNYGRTKGHWGPAMADLKSIEPNADAPAVMRAMMCQRLDWERLPEETQAFLMRITGVETQA